MNHVSSKAAWVFLDSIPWKQIVSRNAVWVDIVAGKPTAGPGRPRTFANCFQFRNCCQSQAIIPDPRGNRAWQPVQNLHRLRPRNWYPCPPPVTVLAVTQIVPGHDSANAPCRQKYTNVFSDMARNTEFPPTTRSNLSIYGGANAPCD